jgi:flagellar basal-body rod protein FlgB
MTIFDRTIRLLERSLDLRSARQRVIASNLANEETPGYRASELTFMDQLQSAHKAGCRSRWRRLSLGISVSVAPRGCKL